MVAARGAHSSTGQRRDFNQMERVRLRAARMFEQGTSQAEVAHRLGTSRQNAHRWHRCWQQGGRAALRAAGRAGRRPKLDSRQRRRVEGALSPPDDLVSVGRRVSAATRTLAMRTRRPQGPARRVGEG
jgi:transposase